MEVRLQKFLAEAGIASRRKAEELILVNWLFSPKVTLLKLLQPKKAELPISVTPAGIVMLLKLQQPEKA